MGFWSSLGSAVGSVCSAVCGGIAAVCGGGIASLAGAVGLALKVTGLLDAAVKVVDVIGRVLGIWGEKETTEEMGDRALQAQEADIRPENFETYEQYLKEIRGLELDPEKSKSYTQAEKIMAGMGVCYWGLDGKYGKGSGDLLTHIVKDHEFFNEKRLGAYLDGVRNVADVARFFSGKLSPDEVNRVGDNLLMAEKKLNPERDYADIYHDLNARKNG